MPFQSESQRKKFLSLVAEGKMSQATFDEWERATDRKHLPERVSPKERISKATKIQKIKKI